MGGGRRVRGAASSGSRRTGGGRGGAAAPAAPDTSPGLTRSSAKMSRPHPKPSSALSIINSRLLLRSLLCTKHPALVPAHVHAENLSPCLSVQETSLSQHPDDQNKKKALQATFLPVRFRRAFPGQLILDPKDNFATSRNKQLVVVSLNTTINLKGGGALNVIAFSSLAASNLELPKLNFTKFTDKIFFETFVILSTCVCG